MVKRKKTFEDPKDAVRQIPLPIQIFLWRQTSPFIRPKFQVRIYEASCVSFERVLVENKLHGMSPSLSDAIASIPRWQLIQASLPHLMHCCSCLLANRAKLGHLDKLGNAETKILYTLHWVLMEAPDKCLEEEAEKLEMLTKHTGTLEHSLMAIQLFVYLFAPLVHSIKESDLTFRLQNGLKLWRALWAHQQPDIPSFSNPVKPKRSFQIPKRHKIPSPEPSPEPTPEPTPEPSPEPTPSPSPDSSPETDKPTRVVPLADISEVSRLSSGLVTPEPPSFNVEIICEICNTTVTPSQMCRCGKVRGDIRADYKRASLTSEEENRFRRRRERSLSEALASIDHSSFEKRGSFDKRDSLQTDSLSESGRRMPCRLSDNFSASHFDVAVVRCLFNPHWSEEGTHWALTYILNRLRQISDETLAAERVRQRSNSSPIPQITISLFSPVPGPPKKYSMPVSKNGKSDIRPFDSKQKKPKLDHEPIELKKVPPGRKFLERRSHSERRPSAERKLSGERRPSGDQGRIRIKLSRSTSLTKSIKPLVPKLIKEELEVTSSTEDLCDRKSIGSPDISKREPLMFKIEKVQKVNVPSLAKQTEGETCSKGDGAWSPVSLSGFTPMTLESPKSDFPLTASAATLDITRPTVITRDYVVTSTRPVSVQRPTMATAQKATATTAIATKFQKAVVKDQTPTMVSVVGTPTSAKYVQKPAIVSSGSPSVQKPFTHKLPTAVVQPMQHSGNQVTTTTKVVVQKSSAQVIEKPAVITTRPMISTSKMIVTQGKIQDFPLTASITATKRSPTAVFGGTAVTANTKRSEVISHQTKEVTPNGNSLTIQKPMEVFAVHSHSPIQVQVQEQPLLTFEEPASVEFESIPSFSPVEKISTVSKGIQKPVMLQRQSPVLDAPETPENLSPIDQGPLMDFAQPLLSLGTHHLDPAVPHTPPPSPGAVEPLSPSALSLEPLSPGASSIGAASIGADEDSSSSQTSPDDNLNMAHLEIPTYLPRSASDTFVNYHTAEEEEIAEAAGSTYYIQEDGQLNYSVVVKALHSIITKDASARVCDVTLSIIETVLEFRVVKRTDNEKPVESKVPVIKVEGEKVKPVDKDGEGDTLAKGLEEMTVHNLIMDTLIQVFRAMGCQHGCGEGLRGHAGEKLRLSGQQCMYRMYKLDPAEFRKYIRYMIATHPLENILDFLHALLGFCEDPIKPVYRPGPSTGAGDGLPRGGFATNFGSGVAGTGVRGILGTIVGSVFKALVTRLANDRDDLYIPENESLYNDVRQLLHYVREAHGGVFRRVALSGLIDSSGKGQKEPKDKDKTGKEDSIGSSKQGSDKALPTRGGKDSGGESGDVSPGTRLRRNIFKLKFHSRESGGMGGGGEDPGIAESDGKARRMSVFKFGLLTVSNNTMIGVLGAPVQAPHRRPVMVPGRPLPLFAGYDKQFYMENTRNCNAHAALAWRNKTQRSQMGSVEGDGNQTDLPDLPTSETSRNKKPGASVYMPTRKKMDDHQHPSFLSKFRKKNKRDQANEDKDEECDTPRSVEEEEEASDIDGPQEKEKKPVDKTVVAAGMKRLTFLMDACNPGMVPDPEFLAAALDLNAPVVARATLFLECSQYVHRCNHGEWPEWMKSRTMPRGRVYSNVFNQRNMSSCHRKNASLQRTAAKMFYLWAEAIGDRLEEIERKEARDITFVIGKVKDENTRKKLRQDDDEEDFLDEATVNPKGTACPHALKMVACQLLLEITAFLRETYQALPKPRKLDRSGFGGRSGRDSEFLELPGSSPAPSLGQVQRQASAGSSATSSPPPPRHSISHVDSPSAGTSERKISFALGGEDEDSHHSSTTDLNQEPVVTSEEKKSSVSFPPPTPTSTTSNAPPHGNRKQSRGGLLRRHQNTSPSGRENRGSFRFKKSNRPDSLFAGSPNSHQGSTDTTPHVKFSSDGEPKVLGMHHESSAPAALGRSGSDKRRKISSISVDEDSTGDTSSVFSDQVSPQEQDMGDGAGSPDTVGLDDIDLSKNMPWIPIVVEIASKTNFICDHQRCCHPNCFERQKRNCYRLMKAARAVYGEDNLPRGPKEPEDPEERMRRMESNKPNKRKSKLNNYHIMFEFVQESGQTHSTLRSIRDHRRESTSSTLDRQVSMFRPNATAAPGASRTNSAVALSASTLPIDLEWAKKEDSPMLRYLKTQVMFLWHSPLAMLAKSAPILTEELYTDILPLAWELLLDSSQQLASAAAAMVLICSVKITDQVMKLIANEMNHREAGQRVDAVQRFAVLWRFRHQVWPRMEEKASHIFRVPPPSIDFTVPSPTIGLSSVAVDDPPWMPVVTSDLEEKVSTEEETRTFAAVAVSRTTQRREHIKKTLLREQEKKCQAREKFHMTNIPTITQAAYEPSHHPTSDDEDDTPLPMGVSMSARRVSIAPPTNQPAGMSRGRNLSIRRASLWSGGTATATSSGDEDGGITERHHSPPTFGTFFPSVVCMTVMHLVGLLDDAEVNQEGVSVGEVAEKVLWSCLVEEPALICRYILEKITSKDKQEGLILLLKKLITHMGELPAQSAHCLFNYLLGFIVYHCRAPHEGANEAIANTLSVIWRIIPFVSGVAFKDLKQTLKKEQCDPVILISANVPCAKKLIVHGPDESDIPTQLPISEDMQFEEILSDCLEFFNIPEEHHNSHFLVDKKTHQMLDVKSYVRDFYAYKRSQCPELILTKMDTTKGLEQLQRQAFTLKLAALGRVYFALSTLQSASPLQAATHISFLHDELIRLPSFPRKALDAEFMLYTIPRQGKELFGLDMLHKFLWVKMIATFFTKMASDFSWSGDIQLFLNVINGALMLHCEDVCILRLCLATYINLARHFTQIFATKGFQYILPSILRVYTHHLSNPLVCNAIEYVCRQFYILHMKPFILQLFGSAAPLIQSEEENNPQKISKRSIFKLIRSLEEDTKDKLDIMENVVGEKPLKTLDFCYSSESASNFTIMEAIRLCTVVVAYAPDTIRSGQMMTVLDALVPQLLLHMKEETKQKDNHIAAKAERETITTLGVSIKSLITGAESLARSTSGPRRIDTTNTTTSFKSSANSQQGSSVRKISRKSGVGGGGIDLGDEDMREDFKFKYNDDRVRKRYEDDSDDAESMNEFRKPRDMLLSVVAEYYCHSQARMKELRPGNEIKAHSALELLDQKCHLRVAEVAHSLLKVAPHDPITMGCKGLQRYITQMIPQTDWSNQDLRPALILILKRLDKLFQKIHKKPTLMRHMDWESVANFLKGVYVTLTRQSIISHLPHLKSLLNICLALLLCDGSQTSGGDGALSLLTMTSTSPSCGVRFTPPPVFCSAVVRVVAMQMHCMKHQYWIKPKDLYTLEQVFGGTSVFQSAERTETILLYLVLPLCLRVGCGRKDSPKIRPSDISFALTVIINALLPSKSGTRQPLPPAGATAAGGQAGGAGAPKAAGDIPSHTNVTFRDSNAVVTETLYEAGFLGLKIMIVCFEQLLSREWFRLAAAVKQLGAGMHGGVAMWSFLDFCITFRTPLYIMLKAFIAFKMRREICETDPETMMQRYVTQKLASNHHFGAHKGKAEIMLELVSELRHLRDNMFVPRDQMKISDELAALTGQRAQVFEEMEIISPFQQRGSFISRLTRKATITSRRASHRGPSRQSSRRGPPSRQSSERTTEPAGATANNSTDPFSLNRTGSFGRRSAHQTDATISEADDEQEEEEDNLGSPLREFASTRRQTTKRLSRSTSARRRCPPPEKMNLKEEIRDVVHIEDPLIEKSDDDIDDASNEQSRLLKSATPSQKHHTFSAPVSHTDTEDDMEGNQETMRLLDMDKAPDATIAGRGGSAGQHDTRV